MKKEIINFLINDLSESLLGDFVNGSPTQRRFGLEAMAKSLYYRLTDKDKNKIINKIKKQNPKLDA